MRRGFSIVPERVDDQFCLQYLYIYVSSVGQISPLAGLYRYEYSLRMVWEMRVVFLYFIH